jgi:hypothetical protein
MNTKEKYEDIKLSLINEKTRDTLEKIRRATKDFTVQNDKADAYVSAVHSKLKKKSLKDFGAKTKSLNLKSLNLRRRRLNPNPSPNPPRNLNLRKRL